MRNWAWWASAKLGLVGQCETGLDRPNKTKLRLDKTQLGGSSKLALWQVRN